MLMHLAMKAFAPGKPPFPLLHVDTTWKFRDMYALRDRVTVAFEDAESISNAGRVLATWKANKDSRKTDWKALSTEWGPPPGSPAAQADIERHTVTTPGARVLRLNTKEQ